MVRHFANQSVFYRMKHARSYDQIVQGMARVIFNKNEELDSAFSKSFALLFKIQRLLQYCNIGDLQTAEPIVSTRAYFAVPIKLKAG